MERKPAGSYGALFVVAKGLSSKIEWKEEEKNNRSYIHYSLVEPISSWLQKYFMKSTQRTHTLQRKCVEFIGDFLMIKLFI